MKAAIKYPGKDWEWVTHDNSLKFLQSIVGGYIESAPNGKTKAIIYCNEDGKELNLEKNIIVQDKFGCSYIICGPVIMLGPVDDDGDTTSLTQELFDKTVSQLEYC